MKTREREGTKNQMPGRLRVLPARTRRSPSWRRLGQLLFLWVPGFVLLLDLLSHTPPSAREFLIAAMIGDLVALCAYVLIHIVERSRDWSAARRGKARPKQGVKTTLTVAAVCLIPAIYIGGHVAAQILGWLGVPFTWENPDYVHAAVTGMVILVIYVGTQTYRELREATHRLLLAQKDSELQLQKAENERLAAQIAALTAQMHPHFLFNALNALAGLVVTAPQKAEAMIIALSELYRAALKASTGGQHSLTAELELCRAYLDLEQTRFGARLQAAFVVAPSVRCDEIKMPILLLQTLLENAVRHGFGDAPEAGRITVEVVGNRDVTKICVIDNGSGFDPERPSQGQGTGLANSRNRLNLHFGAAASLKLEPAPQGGTRVTMTLPSPGPPTASPKERP